MLAGGTDMRICGVWAVYKGVLCCLVSFAMAATAAKASDERLE